MAYNVLYVKGGPSELSGIRSLDFTNAQAIMTATGDNSVGQYPGRKGPVRGTAVAEDGTTVHTCQAQGRIASAAFTCQQEASTTAVTVTFTGLVFGDITASITDGTADGNVVGFGCSFGAESVAVAAA